MGRDWTESINVLLFLNKNEMGHRLTLSHLDDMSVTYVDFFFFFTQSPSVLQKGSEYTIFDMHRCQFSHSHQFKDELFNMPRWYISV